MSNANPNFVSELVQMAKAFEELPIVKAELEAVKADCDTEIKHTQALELRIVGLKNELAAANDATRKAEAERDDAELRFLESEDRVTSALSFIKNTFGSAGSLIQALEPPAPVSIPTPPAEPEVIHQPSWATGGQEDIVVKVGASEGNLASASELKPWHAPTDATMGQSEPNPTSIGSTVVTTDALVDTSQSSVNHTVQAASTVEEAPAAPTADPIVPVGSSEGSGTVTSTGATPIENASPPTTINTSGPYTDKLYVNEPHWMPLEAWLSGGGTEANYYYRH